MNELGMKEKIRIELITQAKVNDIAKWCFKYFDTEVTKYMRMSPDSFEGFIGLTLGRVMDNNTHCSYVYSIIDNDTNEFIGQCGIHCLDSERPELSVWLAKHAQGNNYGKYVIGILIDILKKREYKYAAYYVEVRNAPSIKIAEYYGGVIKGKINVESYDYKRKLQQYIYEIKL